jgi:hypothetical protein
MAQRNCAIQNRFEAYAKLQKHKWNIVSEIALKTPENELIDFHSDGINFP